MGKIFKGKKITVNALLSGVIIKMACVNASAAGISSNLAKAGESAQKEMLGWIEAIGLVGFAVAGILYISSNEQTAKKIASGVVIGYILVKFAPQLWQWFISIF